MMHRKFIIVFVLSVLININKLIAQESIGVKIIKNLSWKEVCEKAQRENKYILVDCNSSWCGPCKFLENRAFPMDTIGKLINPNFIVVSVQFDTTDTDNSYTKSWYSTAQYFKKKYNIQSFPTEIIMDKNANALSKFVGMNTEDPINYLYEIINSNLDSNKQYYILKSKFENKQLNSSTDFKNLISASWNAGEYDEFHYYFDEYLKSLSDSSFATKENYQFIVDNLYSTQDSIFSFVLENYENIDHIVGSPVARDRVCGILYHYIYYRNVFPDAGGISVNHYIYQKEPDWNELNNILEKKHGKLSKNILLYSKMQYHYLERLYDQYLELLENATASNMPIHQLFSETEVLNFCDNILNINSKSEVWLKKGKLWLDDLYIFHPNKRTLLLKNEFASKLALLSK
ncbi:thioredoxin family protein [Rhizosphaericola mali]|uniref:Thioredoxin family protein n=1 Tax=Rhizosphaericola mali TaxID=2545455 RepID=A0A5P2G5I8_9BACT|nr:thioredoxin family protein [Rhizosphaericola mali]QES89020.1 thioredoxin family protein [Rhizosphaericola mali]